jgi:hypothetical protein
MENSRAIKTIRIILSAVIVLSSFVLVGAGTERTFGWDNVEGHPFINEFAYNNFVGQWMPSDQYLKQASLDGSARGESWELKDGTSFTERIAPHTRTKSIKDWLMEGGFSADEPELDMSLVHFYDPVREPHYLTDSINDIPLEMGKAYNPTTDAYQWAFESFGNPFSFANGEQNFLAALASKDPNDINYGKAWRAVGETMHLISDMTIPAHVRNDAHIPHFGLWDSLEFFTKSADIAIYGTPGTSLPATSDFGDYHTAYTNQKDIRSLFREVATWTNQNFLSRDTVPQYGSDLTPNGKKAYANPPVTIDPNFSGYYTTTFDGIDKFPLARASIIGFIWRTPILVVDQTVCNAQRSVLIPTAIKASAAVIDAFLPRFEVEIDKAEPDSKVEGNYVITAHIKQIPTREWQNNVNIRNGAHITVDAKDTAVTTDNNLDNNNNLNTIRYSLPAGAGSKITVYYNFGGYKISSPEFKIPTTVSIDPPTLDGEPNKDYTFTAKTDNPPSGAQYVWSLDGKQVQSGQNNTFGTKFAKAGGYTIGVKLSDGSGKELGTATASVNIPSNTPTSTSSGNNSSTAPSAQSDTTKNHMDMLHGMSSISVGISGKHTYKVWAAPNNNATRISQKIYFPENELEIHSMPITWNGTSFSGTYTIGTTTSWLYRLYKVSGSVSDDGSNLISLSHSFVSTESGTYQYDDRTVKISLSGGIPIWGPDGTSFNTIKGASVSKYVSSISDIYNNYYTGGEKKDHYEYASTDWSDGSISIPFSTKLDPWVTGSNGNFVNNPNYKP